MLKAHAGHGAFKQPACSAGRYKTPSAAGIMLATMIDPVDQVTRPLPVATASPIRMQFSGPDRLHTVVLMQDLFEQWIIIQGWAGKFSRCGGGKTRPFDSLEDGIDALRAIARRHQKQGYTLLS
jgi:hypothetical protein